jgi:hypothetical protein
VYASIKKRFQAFEQIGYDPHDGQRKVHEGNERIKLVAGGERVGKSVSVAAEETAEVLFSPPGSLYWLVAATYELARAEFGYIADGLRVFNPGYIKKLSFPNQGPCSILTVANVEILTKSADDPIRLAMTAPDGILMCEAAQMSEETFLRLRGRIAEKRGHMLLSGTFERGKDWYKDYYLKWQGDNFDNARSYSIPTWANTKIYPGGREDPEIKSLEEMYPAEVFLERFGAVPCPPATLVFPEFEVQKHVDSGCTLDSTLPVHLAIDPGYRGGVDGSYYAVLACQFHGNDVSVIDELYLSKQVHEEVIALTSQTHWWKQAKQIAIDHWGGRQHAMGGKAPAEVWGALTKIPIVSYPLKSVNDAVYLLKTFLKNTSDGRARIKISPRCEGLIREFGRYKYPEDREGRALGEKPIDRYCDSIKALMYLLLCNYGVVKRKKKAIWRSPFSFK